MGHPSFLGIEAETTRVHVHELARFNIFGVVNAIGTNVACLARLEREHLAILDQLAVRTSGKELNFHFSLDNNGHVITGVRVWRLLGARFPLLQYSRRTRRVGNLVPRGAQGETFRGVGGSDETFPNCTSVAA